MLERDCEIRYLMDVHEIKMVLTTYSVAPHGCGGKKNRLFVLVKQGDGLG